MLPIDTEPSRQLVREWGVALVTIGLAVGSVATVWLCWSLHA